MVLLIMKFSLITVCVSLILPVCYTASKRAIGESKPKCGPNHMIMSECNFCTCTATGLLKCRPTQAQCPQDKSFEEIKKHLGEICETGEVMTWDCNRCLCIKPGKVECTEKICLPMKEETPQFDVAEQDRRLNKMGRICRNVGDVIKTNCKSCTCRTPGDMKCTTVEGNCKTKLGLTIKLKKLDEKHKELLKDHCVYEDRITVACNECFCIREISQSTDPLSSHQLKSSSSFACTEKKCEGVNDLPITPSEAEDDGQEKDEDQDVGSEEGQNPGPNQDEEQGPDENQGPDNVQDQKPLKKIANNQTPNEDTCDVQAVLKSYLEIRGRAKMCKPKETLESTCHICECVLMGVVKCTLKGHPVDIELKSNIQPLKAMSGKATDAALSDNDKKAFVEKLKLDLPRCERKGQVVRVDCNNCICESSWMVLCTQKRCGNKRMNYKNDGHTEKVNRFMLKEFDK